jgi:chromosome segregation ATPase
MGKKSKRVQKESTVQEKPQDSVPVLQSDETSAAEIVIAPDPSILTSEQIGDEFDKVIKSMENDPHEKIISNLRDIHIKFVLDTQKLKVSYSESNKDRVRMRERSVLLESRINKLNGEKGILLAENSKTEAMRDKLQDLCRELQKKNKQLAEESHRLIESELSKRKEMSNGFSSSIQDISMKLELQADSSKAQLQENESLRSKLKELLEKFDMQQQYFDNSVKTKDLEIQLAQAKLAQQEAISAQEKEKYGALLKHGVTQEQTIDELKQQISMYNEKFDTFQTSIQTSNKYFEGYKNTLKEYKEKIDEITKLKLKADRENIALKERVKAADVKISKLIVHEKEVAALRASKVKLEKLCRSLVAQKTTEGVEATSKTSTTTPSSDGVPLTAADDVD